jgi:LuxR family transcriptional regulator, maltose regulon positive regulatory protein
LEQCIIKKLSATTGIVQKGTLVYEQQGQKMTALVGTLSWYAWLETATTFTFACEEGTFSVHKMRAGNRRGGWYWRAYRRHKGRLSNCYLGVSANLTLPRLCEAARRLVARSEGTSSRKEGPEQEAEAQTMTLSAVPTPILILNTKFALPRLPVQHVSRPHLLALLQQGMQRPLTLVSAPAGSGKTTLLAEWATTITQPVVRLSCESADNDPARFLSYLLATLAQLDEGVGRPDLVDHPWYARAHEQALTAPLNDLTRLLQQDAVVILDDYHLITADAAHACVRFLLEHLPARLHLMIATRVDPPLPLARLRARNHLSELRIDDLRFASPEVEAFALTMGLTLTREALRLLHTRTEGWIAGIQLLALALRGHADATAFLQASRSTHRFLLDYVSEEVLAQQPTEMQRFLLRTCILEQLTGPLCDAVTGESGGRERLLVALEANLFVSALDDTQTWYRYHPLFAEVLRTRLHALEPDLAPALYFRASCWYEQQHREEEACEYALLAGDQLRAAALLENLIPHLLEQGKFLQMQKFLSQLSPSLVEASPTLWVALISLPMLRTGIQGTDTQTMASIIEQIEQQIQAHAREEEVAWAELRAGLTIMQAIFALVQGDSVRAISLALESEPSPARSRSALSHFIDLGKRGLLGIAYGASGNLAAVEQLFSVGFPSDSTNADQPRNLAVAASLSELYEAHGRLRKLGQFYNDLFQMFAQRSAPVSPMLSVLMQARYALLLYEWNRLMEAEQAVHLSEESVRKIEVTHPITSPVVHLNHWTRTRLALARGASTEAEDVLNRVESEAILAPTARWGQRIPDALRARIALACGQLEPALRWGETCGLCFDDSPSFQQAGSRYFEYITLARVLLAQGRSLRKSVRLSQTAFLLNHLRNLSIENGWQGRLREIEMLLALVLQAQGKTKQALRMLGMVLAQTEPEGYVRLFADEGAPMAHMLAQITAYTIASAGYIQQIQAVLAPGPRESADAARPALRQLLPEPLSPREQEVLQLLAKGFSNQQIADHLIITLNTAKRHIKHLLAKLVVTNRTQALARARELHLL